MPAPRFEVDTAGVALMCGVAPHVIRNWAARGHIQPLRADGTRTIYDAEAVVRVAAARGYVPDVRPRGAGPCCAPRCRADAWPGVPVCKDHALAIWLHVNDEWSRRVPPPPAAADPPQPVVYFVRSGDHIKIGTSSTLSLSSRLSALRTGSGHQVELLLVVAGDRAEERRAHALFADERVRGEWFAPSPRLMAFIAERQDEDVRPQWLRAS